MAAGPAPGVVLPQWLSALRYEGQHCGYGRAGYLYGGAGGAAGAVVASGQRPRQPSGTLRVDFVWYTADSVDAGQPVHLPVSLFPQLDVLSRGAGTGAGPDAERGSCQTLGRWPLRRGGCAVCGLLSGSLRPADSRLVGGCTADPAELWVLLRAASRKMLLASDAEGARPLPTDKTKRQDCPVMGAGRKAAGRIYAAPTEQ